jgi:hypothetical protein
MYCSELFNFNDNMIVFIQNCFRLSTGSIDLSISGREMIPPARKYQSSA